MQHSERQPLVDHTLWRPFAWSTPRTPESLGTVKMKAARLAGQNQTLSVWTREEGRGAVVTALCRGSAYAPKASSLLGSGGS